jgi:hypothetical protein
MEIRLGESIKGMILDGLRHHFQFTQEFPDLEDKIKASGTYDQAPSMGIVVSYGGGDLQRNEGTHYYGFHSSKLILCAVKDSPSISIDYVIQDNTTPLAAPGAYFIHITSWNDLYKAGFYTITPYLSVSKERPVIDSNDQFTLAELPYQNTVRVFMTNGIDKVFVDPSHYIQDVNDPRLFTIEPDMLNPAVEWLEIDYMYLEPTTDPIAFSQESLHTTISGVGIRFGKKSRVNDQQIIFVHDYPVPAHKIFGGLADLSFEITVFARDSETRTRIADSASLYLTNAFRSNLSRLGLVINDVSLGGEEEDSYDDVAGDALYTSSISIGCTGYWKQYLPNDVRLHSASYQSSVLVSPLDLNATIQEYNPYIYLKNNKIIS